MKSLKKAIAIVAVSSFVLASCSFGGAAEEKAKPAPENTPVAVSNTGETLDVPGTAALPKLEVKEFKDNLGTKEIQFGNEAVKYYVEKNAVKFESMTVNGKKITYPGRAEGSKMGKYASAMYQYLQSQAEGRKLETLRLDEKTVAVLGEDGISVKEFQVAKGLESGAPMPPPEALDNVPVNSGTGTSATGAVVPEIPKPDIIPCSDAQKCSNVMNLLDAE